VEIIYFAALGAVLAVFLDLPILGLIVAAAVSLWLLLRWWPHRNDPIDPNNVW
jgi:hypothetical protein